MNVLNLVGMGGHQMNPVIEHVVVNGGDKLGEYLLLILLLRLLEELIIQKGVDQSHQMIALRDDDFTVFPKALGAVFMKYAQIQIIVHVR